jgi:hypothetical protein
MIFALTEFPYIVEKQGPFSQTPPAKEPAMPKGKVKPVEIDEVETDETAQISEIAVDNMLGDVSEQLIALFKDMDQGWDDTSESEQASIIRRTKYITECMIDDIVQLVAGAGMDTVICTLEQITVKNEVKITLTAPRHHNNVTTLSDLVHSSVVLVDASAAKFLGDKSPSQPEPDQRELPVEDQKPVSDTWTQGYNARGNSQPIEDCPFDAKESPETWEEWRRGWMDCDEALAEDSTVEGEIDDDPEPAETDDETEDESDDDDDDGVPENIAFGGDEEDNSRSN